MGHAGEGLTAPTRSTRLEQFFTGTRLIDIVIAVSLIEWLLLAHWHRRTGAGIAPGALLWMLLPGLCLMLTVRGVMLDLPWYLMAMLLAAAGLAHIADLRRRWTS